MRKTRKGYNVVQMWARPNGEVNYLLRQEPNSRRLHVQDYQHAVQTCISEYMREVRGEVRGDFSVSHSCLDGRFLRCRLKMEREVFPSYRKFVIVPVPYTGP